MKKKILFVMNSLTIGGAEKSLLTILNLIDYDKYDVDLFLFGHEGKLFDQLNNNVNLLEESKDFKLFEKNKIMAPVRFLKKLKLKKFLNSLGFIFGYTLNKVVKKNDVYFGWRFVKNIIEINEKEYDTAIAFMERYAMYFVSTNVSAQKKIGFVHNDYSTYYYDKNLDKKYFKDFDHIATVSDHCKEVLVNLFPEYEKKFVVIKNMVSENLIRRLANEKIDSLTKEKNEVIVVSVGRLVNQKGFDRAIEICRKLREDKINVKWYVIGEGPERRNLQNKIDSQGLNDYFILTGADVNPYRWINVADIYVQPSRYEGYGITVAEAKALNKPIVTSDIPEFRELLSEHRGLLAQDENDFVKKIKELIYNDELRLKLIDKLKKEQYNTEELEKLYMIM